MATIQHKRTTVFSIFEIDISAFKNICNLLIIEFTQNEENLYSFLIKNKNSYHILELYKSLNGLYRT